MSESYREIVLVAQRVEQLHKELVKRLDETDRIICLILIAFRDELLKSNLLYPDDHCEMASWYDNRRK